MAYNTIEPDKTGLVFFDALNAYFRGANEEAQKRMEPIVANYVRIREAASAVGIPAFFPKADHRPDGSDSARQYTDVSMSDLQPWPDPENRPFRPYLTVPAGDWKSEVIDELKPAPSDYMVPKHRWSSFYQTHLELSLRTKGIDTLILCGGATEVGIASTAYAARDLDFNLIIVSDATSSPREETQRLFMTRVFPMMARVRTTEEVVQMIEAGVAQKV